MNWRANTPELRRLILDRLEEIDPARTAALSLSGGTDSTTLLFAMLASGRRPTCYTFFCESKLSGDLQAARALARHFKLDLVEVMIPWDLDALVNDLRVLVQAAYVLKRTIVQCMHPYLHIYPVVASDLLLSGLSADDLYATSRRSQITLHTKGEAALLADGGRLSNSTNLNYSNGNIIRFAGRFGKEMADLYDSREIEQWLLQFHVNDLHKPLMKAPSIFAFEDFYSQGAFYRKPSPFQINSSLRELHDALLKSKYNTRDLSNVVGIYNDIAKGII